jgi:hypothetical protein
MKYKELQDRIKQLEQELWFKTEDIKSSHILLDSLGVEDIGPEHGHANVSHRLQWLIKRMQDVPSKLQKDAIVGEQPVSPDQNRDATLPRSYSHKLPIVSM